MNIRKKEQSSDSLQKQVTELKNSLLKSRKVNAKLRLQNKRLKEERDNYELK